jgi:cytochrome b561
MHPAGANRRLQGTGRLLEPPRFQGATGMEQIERGPRYSKVAMLFHWAIAILVIMNWLIAERAHDLPRAEGQQVMGYHMAWGMLILALSLGRLAWRLTHKPPPLNPQLKPWERMLAQTVHTVFYILIIGLPLGAWLASSLSGHGVNFFGLFTIPALPVGSNGKLGHTIFEAHATGGSILIYLVGLHILGALKHTFWDKDGDLFRMLPFGTPKG